MKPSFLPAAVMHSLVLAALLTAGTTPLRAEAPAASAAAPATSPDAVELVRINGKVYTVKALKVLADQIRVADVVIPPDGVGALRGEELLKLARQVGAHEQLAAELKTPLTEEQLKAVDAAVERYAQSQLFRMEILDKEAKPTKEDLDKLYESLKDAQFKREEQLRMRHIFVSTYAEHRVAEGETLESIAKNVAGDVTVADRILSAETKKPRVESFEEQPKEEKKDGKDAKKDEPKAAPRPDLLARALVPGELLKVPMRGEVEKKARAKIDAAIERVKKGEAFADVAKSVSENESPGELWTVQPARDARPIMPELRAAFDKLKDGEYSEPLRTKHGFQVVFREGYTAAGYTPREEAQKALEGEFSRRQRDLLTEAFFARYLADPKVTTIEWGKLKVPSTVANPEDVVLTVGDTKFTRADLGKATRNGINDPKNLEPAAFAKMMANTRPVATAIAGVAVKALNAKDSPEGKEIRSAAEIAVKAYARLEQVVKERVKDVTKEEAKKKYEEEIDSFTSAAGYDVRMVARKLINGSEEATLKELESALAKVASEGDFAQMADAYNSKTDRRFKAGGERGVVSSRSVTPEEKKALEAVTIPGKTALVTANGEAVAYWVRSSTPSSVTPFEQVEESLTRRINNGRQIETRTAILAELAAKQKAEALVK